jgi:cytochrome P450
MHLSFIVLHLARNPQDLAYVKDNLDNLDEAIIPEFNRRFSGVNMFRKLACDVTIDGVTMKAGDMVCVAAPLYNLSDDAIRHSATDDFHRPRNLTHLSFGTGAHTCPGAALARLEVKIFLQEWLRRVPEFTLKEGAPLRLRASMASAVDELSLQWPAATQVPLTEHAA